MEEKADHKDTKKAQKKAPSITGNPFEANTDWTANVRIEREKSWARCPGSKIQSAGRSCHSTASPNELPEKFRCVSVFSPATRTTLFLSQFSEEFDVFSKTLAFNLH